MPGFRVQRQRGGLDRDEQAPWAFLGRKVCWDAAGSFRGKREAGGEAYGRSVPAGEGIDVVGIALVRADDTGEMIGFADADGIVGGSSSRRSHVPPNAGDVIGLGCGTAANLSGALS